MAKTMISDSPSSVTTDPSSPHSTIMQKFKDEAIRWINQVFELQEFALIPGRRRSQKDCPIALGLRAAGLQGVRVFSTRLRYDDPDDGRTIKVMFPAQIRRFLASFDAGLMPELIEEM